MVDVKGADLEGLPVRIDRDSIANTFEMLSTDSSTDGAVKDAKALFETVAINHTKTSALREADVGGQLQHLGYTKIWIRVAEGMPNKALVVRDPGMAICDAVRRFPYLLRLPGSWGDFAAVVVCADKEGNELLRSMEPPAHDGFEPDRLKGVGDDSSYIKGERALGELGRRIREWIDRHMPKIEDDQIHTLDDLAEFFPSDGLVSESNPMGDETDPFGSSFVGETATKLPAVRRPTTPSDNDEEEVLTTDEEGEEIRFSVGSSTGGGVSGNPNKNRGSGKPTKGPRASISGVRMSRENGRLLVSFTPDENFKGNLSIAIASEEKRSEDYVQITGLIDQDGVVTESNDLELESGKRVRFSVQTETPLPEGHALIIEANKEVVA